MSTKIKLSYLNFRYFFNNPKFHFWSMMNNNCNNTIFYYADIKIKVQLIFKLDFVFNV